MSDVAPSVYYYDNFSLPIPVTGVATTKTGLSLVKQSLGSGSWIVTLNFTFRGTFGATPLLFPLIPELNGTKYPPLPALHSALVSGPNGQELAGGTYQFRYRFGQETTIRIISAQAISSDARAGILVGYLQSEAWEPCDCKSR